MKIELVVILYVFIGIFCLNPYSNGMKIEHVMREWVLDIFRVLILILME